MAWNGGLILTSALLGEGTGLLEVITIQTLIVIVPAVLVLHAIAHMSARHDLTIPRDELREEVTRGTITEVEYRTIIDSALRQRALSVARDRGGRALRGRQEAFFQTAAELAFRNYHRRRGEPPKPSFIARDESDRLRLVALRGELAASRVSKIEG